MTDNDESTIRRRQIVADKMDEVIKTAKSNSVGPIATSDLFLRMAATLCKLSGVKREDFTAAADQHYREAISDGFEESIH